MDLIPFAHLELPVGRVLEWRLRAPAAASEESVGAFASTGRASLAQEIYFNLIAQQARGQQRRVAVWLGSTVEIAGADPNALREAFRRLVVRHEALRTVFRPVPGAAGPTPALRAEVLSPEAITLEASELGTFTCGEDARAAIEARADTTLDTNAGPWTLMGVVLGETRSVAYVICDHLVSDGLSCLIKARDLSALYAAVVAGASADLPEAGGGLDHASRERADAARVGPDDPRLSVWRALIEQNGGAVADFPVDLGTTPGTWYPTLSTVTRLVDAGGADAFERYCAEHGANVAAGLLAANALALRELGGPNVFRTMMHVAQRRTPALKRAVGMFLGLVPLTVPVGEAGAFSDALVAAHKAIRSGLRAAGLPFGALLAHVGPPAKPAGEARPRGPQMRFSYIDCRRLEGGRLDDALASKSVLHVPSTNDARSWFYRSDRGIFIMSHFVDTPRARDVLDRFEAGLQRVVAAPRALRHLRRWPDAGHLHKRSGRGLGGAPRNLSGLDEPPPGGLDERGENWKPTGEVVWRERRDELGGQVCGQAVVQEALFGRQHQEGFGRRIVQSPQPRELAFWAKHTEPAPRPPLTLEAVGEGGVGPLGVGVHDRDGHPPPGGLEAWNARHLGAQLGRCDVVGCVEVARAARRVPLENGAAVGETPPGAGDDDVHAAARSPVLVEKAFDRFLVFAMQRIEAHGA